MVVTGLTTSAGAGIASKLKKKKGVVEEEKETPAPISPNNPYGITSEPAVSTGKVTPQQRAIDLANYNLERPQPELTKNVQDLYDTSTYAGRLAAAGVAPQQGAMGMTSQVSQQMQQQFNATPNPEIVANTRANVEANLGGQMNTALNQQRPLTPEEEMQQKIQNSKWSIFNPLQNIANVADIGLSLGSATTWAVMQQFQGILGRVTGGLSKGILKDDIRDNFDDGLNAFQDEIEQIKAGNPYVNSQQTLMNLKKMQDSVQQLESKVRLYGKDNPLYWIADGKQIEQDILTYTSILEQMKRDIITAEVQKQMQRARAFG